MAHSLQGGWRAHAADLDAGHLCAARLDPDSPRGSLLLTIVSVLVADHSSHRATLLAIASGVALDEGGEERGGVNGARDNGPGEDGRAGWDDDTSGR
uniref:Uncharacterized protein n=1 Tax=Oryza barthii TaxID=65489 RepID=A0A0D3G744_9ORYZ